jgi:murein peptide amidase A
VGLGLLGSLASCGGGAPKVAGPHPGRVRVARPARMARRLVLGRSVDGRPIVAEQIGDPRARRRLVVVGCVHGNEPAGIAIARALHRAPPGVGLWVIDDLNPDGVALHTRQNAHRVDLNRNFPWGWRPLDRPGGQQYSGPSPLSEPESRLAYALLRRVRPDVTIWFHQPLGVVDESGGSRAVERRFSSLSGLPLRRLQRYPGSAVGWQDHSLKGTTAFVVELPPGTLAHAAVRRYAQAVYALAASG